tara:strand:- start:387 stop:608 length:222 start_codon:yes stop_codon:yes gene_type:complete
MEVVASFTSYGNSPDTDREVELRKISSDVWSVSVEGYPEISKSQLSENSARMFFEGAKNMAEKDYGSSEINWR